MASISELKEMGQSMWLDSIDRRLLVGDGLMLLIRMGISGVTSNPTIFQQAMEASDAYDDPIRDLLQMNPDMDAEAIYEWLTVRDVQMAADQLHPVYEQSNGGDGYVCLEVSPHLAYDTEASMAAARRLWRSVNRPNLMIKVPATQESLPAVEQLTAEGINVNVTLLFSVERYEAVAEAYLRGLARCATAENVASVASFFLSRIDSKADPILEQIAKPEALALRGRIAVAQARLAYQRYQTVMQPSFAHIRGKRRPQRLLWASTSVKNPAYPDVLYINNLIGFDTVTTVPQETLHAFIHHGTIRASLEDEVELAKRDMNALMGLGVNIETIARELEDEGVIKFAFSYDSALATLRKKRLVVTQAC
jgi:transaldolase